MDIFSLGDKDLLIRIIHHNDQSSFKLFFNRYYSRLVSFSIHFVKTHENAEDVIEEVFYKFLKMGKKVLAIENIQSYIFTMTRNSSIDFVSNNKYQVRHDQNENIEDFQYPSEPSPEQIVESNEFEQLIIKCIDNFPPKRKIIFSLSREESFSYKEIASLLNISEKTVESHIRVALKSLRDTIKEYDSGLETVTRKFNTRI